jgi:hypothetical protein
MVIFGNELPHFNDNSHSFVFQTELMVKEAFIHVIASDEEFIYFHLPPVSGWGQAFQSTVFGLACYRQIPASEITHRSPEVTRTTIQKSVAILCSKVISRRLYR